MGNLICPVCKTSLQPKKTPKGALWRCQNCSGVAVNLAVLRNYLNEDIVKEFWLKTITDSKPSDRRCPCCVQMLKEFTTSKDNQQISLDLCQNCQLLWFDKDELEAFPKADSVPPCEISQNSASASVRLEAELEAQLENQEKLLENIPAMSITILRIIIQLLLAL